jgi:hypothetical protein
LILKYVNKQTGIHLVFGDSAPVFFLSQKGMDGAGAEAVMVKSPYQHGQRRLFADISERIITINGCLVTGDKAEENDLRRRIIGAMNPLYLGDLIVSGDGFEKVFRDVQVVDGPSFSDMDYTVPDGILYFNVTLLVPGNFVSDLEAFKCQLVEVEPGFSYPLEFGKQGIIFGEISKGQAELYNNGDVPAPLIIEIPGPVETPEIHNLTTNEFIKIHTPIESNEIMTIDTSFGNKSVIITDTRGNSRNAFHHIDLESTFFQLIVGKNTVKFKAEVGNETAVVKIGFRVLYLGI